MPLYATKTRSSRSQKIDILTWFWSKIGHYSTFFLGNIGKENVFLYSRTKNSYVCYKSKKIKKLKNWHFFTFFFRQYRLGKCVLWYSRTKKCLWKSDIFPWFSFKIGHYSTFFLGNLGKENVFYGILEQKNACVGFKNRKFKNSKKWHFPKGVSPWFWSKLLWKILNFLTLWNLFFIA